MKQELTELFFSLLFTFLSWSIYVFDTLSLPLYSLHYRPWNYRTRQKWNRSRVIEETPGVSITIGSRSSFSCLIRNELRNSVQTLPDLLTIIFERHGNKNCLGSRRILSETLIDVTNPNSSSKSDDEQVDNRERDEKENETHRVRKLELGPYEYITYRQVRERMIKFGDGLRSLGHLPGDKVVIFSETRAEWMIVALASFSYGFPIVTLYTNLGVSGLLHGLRQTNAKVVVTSKDLLPKVKSLLPLLEFVETLIVFDLTNEEKKDEIVKKNSENKIDEEEKEKMIRFVSVLSFDDVCSFKLTSKELSNSNFIPSPNDVAVIMYTSGSTGSPKAALLTQSNVVHSILGGCSFACNLMGSGPEFRYLAYLPLAHIFELSLEIIMMLRGSLIGYSSPNTLLDSSPLVGINSIGDARALQPTILIAVPVILDRIYKGIRHRVEKQGRNLSRLFDYFVDYRARWISLGYNTPLLNVVLFRQFQRILGGQLVVIIGGGAPLSTLVHRFLQTTLLVKISQGYGLTESTGGVSLSEFDDDHFGDVGVPLPGVLIKLVHRVHKDGSDREDDRTFDDGHHEIPDYDIRIHHKDKIQGLRGEIHVGGPFVSKGYYNLPLESQSDYYVEKGIRWFKTGDIGELSSIGALSIIDRIKDYIKLQNGEYVSCGKVEGILKLHSLVDWACVFGNSFKTFVVAIIVPNSIELAHLLKNKFGILKPFNENNSEISSLVSETLLKLLTRHCFGKLEKFEIPKKIYVSRIFWSPESGHVTPALKLKRRVIQETYQKEIDSMYE